MPYPVIKEAFMGVAEARDNHLAKCDALSAED
jgi:hypothetical protein